MYIHIVSVNAKYAETVVNANSFGVLKVSLLGNSICKMNIKAE
jgi:hypothetical protein